MPNRHRTGSGFYNSQWFRQGCLSVLFFLFLGGSLPAQRPGKKKILQQIDIEYSLAGVYDNNILKYSRKYLERFKNREDEGRFHIKTYDDLIVDQSLELTATLNFLKRNKTKINGAFSRQQYLCNDIRNWNVVRFGLEQLMPGRSGIKLFYSYIPDFYVRHFRDDEWVKVYGYTPETFQPFSFSKRDLGVYLQKTFYINSRLRFTFQHTDYFHNQHFTEYDCKNYSYGLTLFQPLHRIIRAELGYHFVYSAAKGYDASYQTRSTSNGPDASFNENRFNLVLNLQLPVIFHSENDLETEFEYAKRFYLSGNPADLDPLHAGRTDHNLHWIVTYNFRLQKSLKIALFYSGFSRDSRTSIPENEPYVSDEKDYQQSLYGLTITCKLKLPK